MLIDRADRVVNLCEMKFTRDEFMIGPIAFLVNQETEIIGLFYRE